MNEFYKKIKKRFDMLGPGLITGISDDDPSGIATCSQTGAKFGFAQLWTAFFLLPLMYIVQECSTRISAKKGRGLIHVINHNYGYTTASLMVLLLLIANVINIAADLGSVVESTQLIIPINFSLLLLLYIVFISASLIFMGYKKYARFLKWLSLSILAYPITIFISHPPYLSVLKSTFIPEIHFNYHYFFLLTGLLGTTLSPYMFFWQSSQEVEEEHKRHLITKKNPKPKIKNKDFERIRFDTLTGMIVSQITTWAIIVVAGTNFHLNNITEVTTAQQAAKMLVPLVHNFPHSGFLAEFIFAIGIIGLGLVAIPVLAGSISYSVCELTKQNCSLDMKFKQAKIFYLIMIMSFAVGSLLNYIGINPIKLLVYAAVINGVLAVPLIAIIALISNNPKIMGKHKNNRFTNFLIWLTFICMLLSVLSMFVSFFTK